MAIITKLHNNIIKRSFLFQVSAFLIFSYLLSFLLSPILYYTDNGGGRDLSVIWSQEQKFFVFFAIFLSPLIETFIFQWLVYEQLQAYAFFRKRIYLVILISGVIFGLIHNFSTEYQIFGFFLGCYLCFTYHYFKTFSKYAFFAVFIIHAFRNLLVVLGQFYLKN